jgi:uncharacterized membrane protein YtjA (UPF0391 family)
VILFAHRYSRANAPARFSRCNVTTTSNPLIIMLSWTLTFLVIALIAAILGFGVLAGTAVYIAKVIFILFLVMFVVSLIMGRRMPRA